MAKMKIRSAKSNGAPCPPPPPPAKPAVGVPTREMPPMPLPPPPFMPGPPPCCCGPSTEQVVDNVTVVSLNEDLIQVIEGTYQGMKAYGIDGTPMIKYLDEKIGVDAHEYTVEEIDRMCDEVDAEL